MNIYLTIALWAVGGFLLIQLATAIGSFIMLCVPARGADKRPKDPVKSKRYDQRNLNRAKLLGENPEDLAIQSADGVELRAYFFPTEKEQKRFAILCHGHHATGMNEFSHITPFYRETLGWNVLLPDHQGHGRSGGKWIGFAAKDWSNINLWVKYLVERFGEDIEILLHGISMGAATVCLVNGNNPAPQVKIVVEDCGFTNQKMEVRAALSFFVGSLEPFFRMGEYMGLAIQKLIAGFSHKDCDPLAAMPNAKAPILFVHGGKDRYVPTRFVYELFDACPVPKKLFIVPDAIHAYSYWDNPQGYDEALVDFIGEHMGFSDEIKKLVHDEPNKNLNSAQKYLEVLKKRHIHHLEMLLDR